MDALGLNSQVVWKIRILSYDGWHELSCTIGSQQGYDSKIYVVGERISNRPNIMLSPYKLVVKGQRQIERFQESKHCVVAKEQRPSACSFS